MKRENDKTLSEKPKAASASHVSEELTQLRCELEQREAQYRLHIDYLERALATNNQLLQDIYSSRGWRLWMALTRPVRFYRRLMPCIGRIFQHPSQAFAELRSVLGAVRADESAMKGEVFKHSHVDRTNPHDPEYQAWIGSFEGLTDQQKADCQALAQNVDTVPTLALLLDLNRFDAAQFDNTLQSVVDQDFQSWELWLVGPAGRIEAAMARVPEGEARVRNLPKDQLSGAESWDWNGVLEQTRSDFIGAIVLGDRLARNALCFVGLAIRQNPDAELVYSDEDCIDSDGYRFDHYFKPDFNPDLLLEQNYISRLGMIKTTTARRLGGFREAFQPEAFFDLALRLCLNADKSSIKHVERVLYHMGPRSAEWFERSVDARVESQRDCLENRGYRVTVSGSPLLNTAVRVQYALPEQEPRVSIIIPTRNGLALLRQCIDSIRTRTDYDSYEVLIVDNGSDEADILRYFSSLEDDPDIRVISYPGAFNFSAINNFAVRQAQGDVLVFLNNDIEVISPEWLREMVSLAIRDKTGAVGARLWYPDDRLQHAGVVVGIRGLAGHVMKMLPKGSPGYRGRALSVQNYSALTAACLAVRKSVFESIDGFDEVNLAVAFNDVDFCLRLVEAGYDNVWTPYAELYHHESATRGAEDTPEKQQRFQREVHYMLKRWASVLPHDPAYNRNLTRVTEGFHLAW
jgi:O-antigen biosynthesis protein